MGKIHSSPTLDSCQFDLVLFASKFDFVATEALLPEIVAVSKFDAIRQLVEALGSVEAIPRESETSVLSSVMRREQLGTTGIGRGIAIPHAKHPAVREVVASIAYCPEGIDFDSLDGRKVQLVILVLSPVDAMTEHLQALQQIAVEVRNGGGWEGIAPSRT